MNLTSNKLHQKGLAKGCSVTFALCKEFSRQCNYKQINLLCVGLTLQVVPL